MKRILIFLIFLLMPVISQSQVLYDIEPYQRIYFLFGLQKDYSSKYQISFKYPVIKKWDVYVAYTQVAIWRLYDKSSPFEDINHNPSIFWEKEEPFKYFDFVRIIPYEHKSNGRDGDDSRSIDRWFIEAQISYGDFINFGVREKAGGYYQKAQQNIDIERHIGYCETELFIQLMDKHGYFGHERLYIKGEWTNKFGWCEVGIMGTLFTKQIALHWYIQGYFGSRANESLLRYSDQIKQIRAGFIF